MKKLIRLNIVVLAIFASVGGVGQAQSTAFTYQGSLNDSGGAANGSYDLSFAAYDAASSGNLISTIVTNAAVMVSNGLFTTTVDFGGSVFGSRDLWLEITVSTNAANAFTTIAPRQQFSPTPYALYAQRAGIADLANTANTVASSSISVQQLNTPGAPASGQVLSYNGTQLVWQDPVVGGNTGGWALTGNLGTTAGINFLGTLDNQPLELKVGGVQALWLQPGASASATPSLVGGFSGNAVGAAWSGAFIGGGGYNNHPNTINNNWASVLGGYGNTASGYGSVVIGANSTASGSGDIAIGYANTASGGGSSIAMGELSLASGAGSTAIGENATASGVLSTAIGTVATASGAFSMALGYGPSATNDYSFVWSDGNPFYSSASHQFLIHADGGVGIGTSQTPPGGLRVDSGGLAVTGGSSPHYPGAAGVFLEKAGGVGAMFAYNYNSGGGPLSLSLNSPGGNVGIGTIAPQFTLDVSGITRAGGGLVVSGASSPNYPNTKGVYIEKADYSTGGSYGALYAYNYNNPGPHAMSLCLNSPGGFVGIGTITPGYTLDVNGTTRTHSIIITGGADLAEPFKMGVTEITKGSVVVIDKEHAGTLKLSSIAYDKTVAGIVSGANGINPGISLHQEGALEGGQNIALSGRVYVQADASNGAIEPGDFLTTSSIPGCAMKVTDFTRAQGAILGKAMTALVKGNGMVLVLVSLQ